MPTIRNRAQPTLRSGHRQRAGSTASIPGDETDTADEGAPVAQNYGNLAGMLTDDQRLFQFQGEDGTENIEEDEEGGEDEDPGRCFIPFVKYNSRSLRLLLYHSA